MAANTVTGILVKLPAEPLADWFGTGRVITTRLLAKTSAPFLQVAATIWPILLLLRLYHGLSAVLLSPAAAAEGRASGPRAQRPPPRP